MPLQNLQLTQFKNYDEAHFEFAEGFTCLCGPNGAGKTNVLDAIHYISTGKSYFNTIDTQNIKDEEAYFNLKASWNDASIFCAVGKGKKKKLTCDNSEYQRLVDHYGKFPCMLITPTDIQLITDGNEARRRFLDSSISLYDSEYVESLISYNKVLNQRNELLKSVKQHRMNIDFALLEVYDRQLATQARLIYHKRLDHIDRFIPHVDGLMKEINQGAETVQMEYKSDLEKDDLQEQLAQNLEEDIALGRTNRGVHKDKLELSLKNRPYKKFGSQGQQKTLLFALKLAEVRLVHQLSGKHALILLDDVFDRLDDERAANLLKLLSESGSQVVLTDTSLERVKNLLGESGEVKYYSIRGGKVNSEM